MKKVDEAKAKCYLAANASPLGLCEVGNKSVNIQGFHSAL